MQNEQEVFQNVEVQMEQLSLTEILLPMLKNVNMELQETYDHKVRMFYGLVLSQGKVLFHVMQY